MRRGLAPLDRAGPWAENGLPTGRIGITDGASGAFVLGDQVIDLGLARSVVAGLGGTLHRPAGSAYDRGAGVDEPAVTRRVGRVRRV